MLGITKKVAIVQAKLASPPTIVPTTCPAPWRMADWITEITVPTTS